MSKMTFCFSELDKLLDKLPDYINDKQIIPKEIDLKTVFDFLNKTWKEREK